MLNDDEVDPAHVVVLATEKRVVDALRGRELAGWTLGDGSVGTIQCETVHRFKGLEREVVVLVIPSLPDDESRRLAYVGMSRAMVLLFVVGPNSLQAKLSW